MYIKHYTQVLFNTIRFIVVYLKNMRVMFILLNKKASPNVATNVMTRIMDNSKINSPTDGAPIVSLSVIKLKKITPKISDKLLS